MSGKIVTRLSQAADRARQDGSSISGGLATAAHNIDFDKFPFYNCPLMRWSAYNASRLIGPGDSRGRAGFTAMS